MGLAKKNLDGRLFSFFLSFFLLVVPCESVRLHYKDLQNFGASDTSLCTVADEMVGQLSVLVMCIITLC